jgi:hypothetical protein
MRCLSASQTAFASAHRGLVCPIVLRDTLRDVLGPQLAMSRVAPRLMVLLGIALECGEGGIPKAPDLLENSDQFLDRLVA